MHFIIAKRLMALALSLLGLLPAAMAHELPDNRATLVLRDRTHLSVTLYIDYVEVLHRALAPQQKFQEFLLQRAAMSPQAFQREVDQVQTKFQNTTRLLLPTGGQALLTRWNWPGASGVQYALRQRAMQTMVAGHGHDHDHGHEGVVEVRAEAHLQHETDSLRVQFPEAFEKVMVVSYRPNQVWVDAKAASAVVRF